MTGEADGIIVDWTKEIPRRSNKTSHASQRHTNAADDINSDTVTDGHKLWHCKSAVPCGKYPSDTTSYHHLYCA